MDTFHVVMAGRNPIQGIYRMWNKQQSLSTLTVRL